MLPVVLEKGLFREIERHNKQVEGDKHSAISLCEEAVKLETKRFCVLPSTAKRIH